MTQLSGDNMAIRFAFGGWVATFRAMLLPAQAARLLLGLLLGLVFAGAAGRAQTTVWTSLGEGDFGSALNWLGGTAPGVPTSGTDAFIQNGTLALPTVVDLASGATGNLRDLTLGAHDSLVLHLGSALVVSGPSIANDGNLSVQAGFGNNTSLEIAVNTTLSGTGTLSLSYGDHNGTVLVAQASGGLTLTNATETIQGDGIIGNGGLTFVNGAGGTVDANVSGATLILNGSGGTTNTGVLEATGGGILQVTTALNNTGGNIIANGGVVDLGATVTGGTLTTAGSGLLQTAGAATLVGVTLPEGTTYTGDLGTTTTFVGTTANHGSLQFNAGFGTNTSLNLGADVTLSGGGSVTLDSGDNNGAVIVQQSVGSVTLTNVDNLIQGYGIVGNGGLAVVNEGAATIAANVLNQTLTLNGLGGLTNRGLLEATGGGTLQVSTPVDNLNGAIVATSGTVQFSATVSGGTLSGAHLRTNGSATLDGLTEGGLVLLPGSVYTGDLGTSTSLLGAITNGGTLHVIGGEGNNSFLNLAADVTLTGGGAVTLSNGDDNGRPFVQQAIGGVTLTNVDNVISGAGTIGNGGLTFVNQSAGVLNANLNGQVMLLNGSGNITNLGLIEATAGGGLTITNTIANVGGFLTSSGGAVVVDGTGTIQGGTLTTTAGGTMGTDGAATLDGSIDPVTLTAGSTWTGSLGSATNLLGTITNQGTFALAGGSGHNTFLVLNDDVTLQGGGHVILNNGDDNGRPFVQQGVGGLTLTNVDNVIEGAATIGNGGLTLVNAGAGTVDGNISGETMLLNGSGGVTNTGLLEATGGGILQISTVIDNQRGTIAAASGTAQLSSTIEGGTLTGGNFQTGGSATLDGRTAGALTLATGSNFKGDLGTTTTLEGTIVNQGGLQLNAGSGHNTFLEIATDTTLQGSGSVTLSSGDLNGQVYVAQAVGGVTLTNQGNILEGYGIIGSGGLSFVNELAGVVRANVANETLTLDATGTVTNSGTFAADGGTLSISAALTNFSPATLTGGTWRASNGGTLSFETTGNAIVDNAGTLVLDGPGSSIRTRTGPNDTYQQLEETLATNSGTLEVIGNRDFSATNAVANNGTLQLGGGTFTAPALANGPASVLSGFGTFAPVGGVTAAGGARLSPGSAVAGQRIATLAFGSGLTLGGGGVYTFDLSKGTGAEAGIDNDALGISGTLAITASGGNPFTIAVESIDPASGSLGNATFNLAQTYTWTLATAGAISGFDPSDFHVDTSSFQNPLGGGGFTVGESGDTLTLTFIPVPEPETWMLTLLGIAGLILSLRAARRHSACGGGRA